MTADRRVPAGLDVGAGLPTAHRYRLDGMELATWPPKPREAPRVQCMRAVVEFVPAQAHGTWLASSPPATTCRVIGVSGTTPLHLVVERLEAGNAARSVVASKSDQLAPGVGRGCQSAVSRLRALKRFRRNCATSASPQARLRLMNSSGNRAGRPATLACRPEDAGGHQRRGMCPVTAMFAQESGCVPELFDLDLGPRQCGVGGEQGRPSTPAGESPCAQGRCRHDRRSVGAHSHVSSRRRAGQPGLQASDGGATTSR